MDLSLPEKTRQEYLQAMGIAVYLPRVNLPGAPETRLSATETEVAAPPEPEEPQSPPAKQVPEKPDLVPAPAAAPRAVAAEEAPPEKEPPKPDEFRLQLVCIQAGDHLAIINVMPHLGPGQLSGRHGSLLENILKSSGISSDALNVESKPFQWPMMQGADSDNSRPAAAKALMAYLQQKRADWNFSTLLVMGEQAIRQVFEEMEDEDIPNLQSQEWQTHFCRSLDELLHNPPLKKELLEILKSLPG